MKRLLRALFEVFNVPIPKWLEPFQPPAGHEPGVSHGDDFFHNGETVLIRDQRHQFAGREGMIMATGSADEDELHIRLNRPPGWLVRARRNQIQKVIRIGQQPEGLTFDTLEFAVGDTVIVDSQMSIYHQLEAVVTGFEISLSEQPWIHIQITTPGKSFNDTPRFRVADLVKHEDSYFEGERKTVRWHDGTESEVEIVGDRTWSPVSDELLNAMVVALDGHCFNTARLSGVVARSDREAMREALNVYRRAQA